MTSNYRRTLLWHYRQNIRYKFSFLTNELSRPFGMKHGFLTEAPHAIGLTQ